MLKEEENIQWVVKNDLCTGCGTCISLCPSNAIKIHLDSKKGIYTPVVTEKCEKCSSCVKVCPGHSIDFRLLNEIIFENQLHDEVIGNFRSCYTGNSCDKNIRFNSSSGGVINQILISAIELGVIDGALVTRMKKKQPWEPEPFIARTKEEIIEASNAKYCPVPANIALKEIIEAKEGEKFAVVGLPCHIHGIRKAELINKKLKEKIILHLGIFCSCGINFLATEYVLNKLDMKKEDLELLNYRGGDFPPGYTKIKLKNKEAKEITHVEFWDEIFSSVTFFAPKRCIFCYDQTNELTDISIGSGWFPYLEYNNMNQSAIISRTKNGEELLKTCQDNGQLNLFKIPDSDVKKLKDLQNFHGFKKRIGKNYLFASNKLRNKIPNYNIDLPTKVSSRTYLSLVYLYLRIYISSKKNLWNFLYFLRRIMRNTKK